MAGDRKGLKAFFNKSPAGAGNPSALEGRPPLTKEIYNYQPIDVVIMGRLRVFASHCGAVGVVFFFQLVIDKLYFFAQLSNC